MFEFNRNNSLHVRSNGEWLGRSVVFGFFIAPIEALPETSVTDVVSQVLPENNAFAGS